MDNIKPWFKEDLERIYSSIYFASATSNLSKEEKLGFSRAIASVCLAFGINPSSFLSPEDLQLLKGKR